MLSSGKAIRVWDFEQKVPYLKYNDEWFGYDDIQSLTYKVSSRSNKSPMTTLQISNQWQLMQKHRNRARK